MHIALFRICSVGECTLYDCELFVYVELATPVGADG